MPNFGRLKFALNLVGRSALRPMQGRSHKPILAGERDLGITFIGHSTFLIQIAGLNLIVDPVFADWLVLLRRIRRPGVKLKDLPPIDAVLLTHAHMDHLNFPSLRKIIRHTLRKSGKAPAVVVPWGVEDLVRRLGFSRVISLQWWQSVSLDGGDAGPLELTLTPAQHWGARLFRDTHRGFGGYMLRAGGHSVYHSGDTGYFPGFREIGERLKPEVALLPIGAYKPDSFRRVHTSPSDALRGFIDLGASRMIPMHFGTFQLSFEGPDEPLPELFVAARRAGLSEAMLPLEEGQTWISPAGTTSSSMKPRRAPGTVPLTQP
ncbi:MBL fold metallo-hydrolase [Paracidobacterium acidisoli]|uniref:MBL fold metallo-hydrolase n=1 Tax=Paracidobacterium acidisoli TaxID=2303751 RepID=A0A372IT59_9BACT|nr:MBL fold metallo-hydrolase [Paracidobacterium acidisoli]MBT9330515.1 MBL fold metallo-hydrolase [Paracidobacterium acidisoli]